MNCACRAGDSQEFGHGTNCPRSPSYRPPTHIVINGHLYRLVPVK